MEAHELLLLPFLLCALLSNAQNKEGGGLPPPPSAPKRTVTNVYWGVSVQDDYQYMEDLSDPEVVTWGSAQNAYARAWLDGHEERARILQRVVELTHSPEPEYSSLRYRSGSYFAIVRMPPKEQPFLVVLPSVSDRTGERVLVDPNALDPSGGTSIDFYSPSLDGKKVAVSLSQGGTEDGTLHVYDVETGRELPDRIPRVNGGTAGGSVAWNGDGSGFYYTRYPREGERPPEDLPFYQQLYFHRLGEPADQDTYILGDELPKIAEIELQASPDGRNLLIDVSNGDGGEHGYWFKAGALPPAQIAGFSDHVVEAHLGIDGAAYLLSREKAPNGKILRLDLQSPALSNARQVVPETDRVLQEFVPTASRLYVVEMVAGPSRVRVYDLDGNPAGVLELKEIASFLAPIRTEGDDILVRSESYTAPPAYYRCEAASLTLERTALAHSSNADFGDCEVRRETVSAADGARIPLTILMRKGTRLDGANPTILYGYGSYGSSITPGFGADRKLWIERGGIFAFAGVRGGGEYGEEWHHAGRLEKKKTSMDDLAACARALVATRYTSKDRLALEGGSAGGLLVYGTAVHYPDIARAVIADVGYGDVLRTELSPNGLFNTTEFGTVQNEAQFRGMLAYSPYHQVKDGTAYPAFLALTGMNDPRVEPWQSFKMVARLQASGSSNVVLLRTSAGTGHGIGTAQSERDQELADIYTFLVAMLGTAS